MLGRHLKNKKIIRKSFGFTLIEALVASVVFFILFVAVIEIFRTFLSENEKAKSSRLLVDHARDITEQMRYDLSTALIIPEGGCHFDDGDTDEDNFAFSSTPDGGIIFMSVIAKDEENCTGYTVVDNPDGPGKQLYRLENVYLRDPTITPYLEKNIYISDYSITVFDDGLQAREPFVKVSLTFNSTVEGVAPLSVQFSESVIGGIPELLGNQSTPTGSGGPPFIINNVLGEGVKSFTDLAGHPSAEFSPVAALNDFFVAADSTTRQIVEFYSDGTSEHRLKSHLYQGNQSLGVDVAIADGASPGQYFFSVRGGQYVHEFDADGYIDCNDGTMQNPLPNNAYCDGSKGFFCQPAPGRKSKGKQFCAYPSGGWPGGVAYENPGSLPIVAPLDQTYTVGGFGSALATNFDGDRIVVGAPNSYFGERQENQGAAVIYEKIEGDWEYQRSIFETIKRRNSRFGQSLAMSHDGKKIIVGASGRNHVYVYNYNGGLWDDVETIPKPAGVDNLKAWGSEVAMSWDGTRIAVGAPQTSAPEQPSRGVGSVHFYRYEGGTWAEEGSFIGPSWRLGENQEEDAKYLLWYGESLDMSDDYLAVGARMGNTRSGFAQVYKLNERNGNTTWDEEYLLYPVEEEGIFERYPTSTPSGLDLAGNFGYDVDLCYPDNCVIVADKGLIGTELAYSVVYDFCWIDGNLPGC